MSHLFLDSRSKVAIYDKREAVPGGISVSTYGNVDGTLVYLRPLITGVSVRRNASAQLRKALDRSFHLTSFGEQAGDVGISGIVIVGSQYAYRKHGGAKEFYNEGEVTGFGVEAGGALKRYSDKKGIHGTQESRRLSEDDSGNAAADGFKVSSLFGGREDFSKTVLQSAQNLRGHALGFSGSSAPSTGFGSVVSMVSKGVSKFSDMYDKTHDAINNLASVPGRIVEAGKTALGLSLSDAYSPPLDANDLLVTSAQALHAFFHIANAGTGAVETTVSTCGVTMQGHVFGMTLQSLQEAGTGYAFTLSMKVTQFYDFKVAKPAMYIDTPGPTAALVGGSTGVLFGTGKEMVFSALRRHGGTAGELLG